MCTIGCLAQASPAVAGGVLPGAAGARGSHVATAARSATGMIALRAALEMIGVPYSWGGGGVSGPGYGIGRGARTKGFDCSGLAEYAYARAGTPIGTTTTEQWRSGVRIPRELLEPGDLVFFDNDRERPGPEHVGLAVDDQRMVHAPSTGALVRIDSLNRPDLLGVVRPEAGRGEPGM
ncbi:C40 family peptidase [Nonomuraea candida]|uniref:C40 family peptidase n=1 Tax=Nonomuraea candida TaxID=359159 RepID=UPI00069345A1|nr:C40 family peptidase [Nonomuraea candida]